MKLSMLLCERGEKNTMETERRRQRQRKVEFVDGWSMRGVIVAHFQWSRMWRHWFIYLWKIRRSFGPQLAVCVWESGSAVVAGVWVETREKLQKRFPVIFSSSDAVARFSRSPERFAKALLWAFSLTGKWRRGKEKRFYWAPKTPSVVLKVPKIGWDLCWGARSPSKSVHVSSDSSHARKSQPAKMKGIFLRMSGKWAFDLGKETESDNNKTRIFSQISMRFGCWVCVLKEEEKRQLEKEISNSIQANRF